MGDYLLPSCNPLFLSWSPPTSPAPTPPSPPPPASLSLLTNSGHCTADDCGFRRNLCWPDLLVSSANSAPSLQGPLFKSGDASDLTYTSFAAAGSSAAGRITDFDSERLTDSFVDLSLGELASRTNDSLRPSFDEDVFLALSNSFSDFSVCSSDISGELHRLATLTVDQSDAVDSEAASEHE